MSGNSVDAAAVTDGAGGIVVAETVSRVLVSANTVSDVPSQTTCISMAGVASASRVDRENLCW